MKKKAIALADTPWDEIKQAVRELNGDLRFQLFMQGIEGLKEIAVDTACDDETLKHERLAKAAIGTVRAFKEIIAFVADAGPVQAQEVPPQE